MALDTLAAVATAPAAQGKTSSTVTPTALAPGFRFHPTDEELVSYYLKRKVLNKPVRFNAIAEVDIYKKEPWELSECSRLKTRDQEWYFFSALDKKYGNGARMNRATGQGYWKATGKDREIRREVQLIGMKKTLVFHSGRAPDGIRTNWVMHEYRLIDDELEKGVAIKNAYVLCRVFHKNNIGPPSGNRYAPFVEEEWDDGKAALVPREDAKDDQVFAEIQSANKDININELPTEAQIGGDEIVYTPFDYELPRSSKHVFPVCKREKMDDCPPVCMLNKQASSIPLLYYKRRRQVDLGINLSSGSDDSPKTPQEHCSSTTTTAATPASSSATTTAISALLEFCLMESVETKEKEKNEKEKEKFPVGPATYGAALVDPTIPRSCVKLLSDMQSEIDQTTAERDNLKLEILKSQAMISILHSRIDYLMKENEDMKKIMSNAK